MRPRRTVEDSHLIFTPPAESAIGKCDHLLSGAELAGRCQLVGTCHDTFSIDGGLRGATEFDHLQRSNQCLCEQRLPLCCEGSYPCLFFAQSVVFRFRCPTPSRTNATQKKEDSLISILFRLMTNGGLPEWVIVQGKRSESTGLAWPVVSFLLSMFSSSEAKANLGLQPCGFLTRSSWGTRKHPSYHTIQPPVTRQQFPAAESAHGEFEEWVVDSIRIPLWALKFQISKYIARIFPQYVYTCFLLVLKAARCLCEWKLGPCSGFGGRPRFQEMGHIRGLSMHRYV